MAFVLAMNEEISLVMPEWYDDEHEFFKIVLNDTKEVVGNITMRNKIDSSAGNIEYFIFEEYRGNNYAKKAFKLFARNVSEVSDEDLFISILPNNTASIKTAVGAGALFHQVVEIPKNYRMSEDGKNKYANMYIIKNDRVLIMRKIKVNSIYKHRGKTWARPINMFLSEVDKEKYPDVKQKYRFEEIREEN